MDTMQPASAKSYNWPTALLASLNLRRQAVGGVGWISFAVGGTRQRVYLPLRISQRLEPARSSSYRLVLVPGRQLSEVYVHLAPVNRDGRLGGYIRKGEPLRYGQYPADQGIVLPISRPATPGIYYLEIGADLAGGGVATTQLYFYHAGN